MGDTQAHPESNASIFFGLHCSSEEGVHTQSLLGWPCPIPPVRHLQHQQLPLGLVNGCFPVAEEIGIVCFITCSVSSQISCATHGPGNCVVLQTQRSLPVSGRQQGRKHPWTINEPFWLLDPGIRANLHFTRLSSLWP